MRRVHVIALNNTIIASPTTVVTLRYGWTFFGDHVTGIPHDLSELDSTAHSPTTCSTAVSKRHHFGIQRPSALAAGEPGELPVVGDERQCLQVRRPADIRACGADFRQIGADALVYGTSGGNFNFDKEWTQRDPFVAASNQGNAFASFLLGLPTANPSSPSSAPVSTPIDAFIRYYAGYFQDDFRVGLEADAQLRRPLRVRIRPHRERRPVHRRVRSRRG